MTPLAAFEDQAKSCAALGSAFTARLLRAAALALDRKQPVGARVLGWTGDPSSAADSVPLRLAAALHALVLSGRAAKLAAFYPPNPAPTDTDLKAALADILSTETDFVLSWLTSPPQTNETGRSAALLPAAMLIHARFGLPLRLLELGTSAGLNLRWDHVALATRLGHVGPAEAALTLKPDWIGRLPETLPFSIASREGVDLNPVDPSAPADRLRLLSYVWPDQPDRLDRMRAALDLATEVPAVIAAGDAAAWLEQKLKTPAPGQTSVVFHTIAWQYFPAKTQQACRDSIARAGEGASDRAPLVWLSMEADDKAEGAALNMRLWPGDVAMTLGRADFHGRWINWEPHLSDGPR